jgi:hypothetical protein
MIRVTISLLPGGDETRAETLGTVDIINDLSGNPVLGNYRILRRDERGLVKARGNVAGHARSSGWLPLLGHALDVLLDKLPLATEDERRARTLRKMKAMTADEIFALSVRAGIHNPDGTLTAHYRDDEDE